MFANLDPQVALALTVKLDQFLARLKQVTDPVTAGFAQGIFVGQAMLFCENGFCSEADVMQMSDISSHHVFARLVELGHLPRGVAAATASAGPAHGWTH